MSLDTKQAVKLAKDWLTEQLADEKVEDIGLEEVKFDQHFQTWEITLGFSRPWDRKGGFLATMTAGNSTPRSYKVLVVSDVTQTVTEMRNRDAA